MFTNNCISEQNSTTIRGIQTHPVPNKILCTGCVLTPSQNHQASKEAGQHDHNPLIETEQEPTQVLKFLDKDIKAIIKTISYVQKVKYKQILCKKRD